MNRFTYPATLTPDEVDGGLTVTFRDVPEAITQGNTVEECLEEAADCLEEAIAGRIRCGEAIPNPTRRKGNESLVPVPLQTAMKAALYLSMRESGISKVELAQQLHIHEKEVRRMLDPHHGTRISAMEHALSVFGKQAELRLV